MLLKKRFAFQRLTSTGRWTAFLQLDGAHLVCVEVGTVLTIVDICSQLCGDPVEKEPPEIISWSSPVSAWSLTTAASGRKSSPWHEFWEYVEEKAL